jgi:ankyrin repeat protein
MRVCFPIAVFCVLGCWLVQTTLIARPARPLFAAIERNDLAGIQDALAWGHSIEARNDQGQTPLIAAASTGKLDAVRDLLTAGAAIEAVADDGATALAHAARHGHRDVIRYLLSHGARQDFPVPISPPQAIEFAHG